MTKQELEQIRAGKKRVDSLRARILRLRESQEIATRLLTGMPAGGNGDDKLARYVAELDELECTLAEEVIFIERNMQRIDEELRRLPAQQEQIIRLRYYEALKWREVAQRAHYSERYCKWIGCKVGRRNTQA